MAALTGAPRRRFSAAAALGGAPLDRRFHAAAARGDARVLDARDPRRTQSQGVDCTIGGDPDLLAAIWVSLELAALTVVAMLVLLVPTMVWVQLRLPGLSRLVEFVCLLPLTIPAIVLVVGLAPVYHGWPICLADRRTR